MQRDLRIGARLPVLIGLLTALGLGCEDAPTTSGETADFGVVIDAGGVADVNASTDAGAADAAHADAPVCVPAAETGDGVDNDCNGEIDEDLAAISCGVGACEHTVPGCEDGAPVFCNPFEGAGAETCDGTDNDCNGETDEHLGTLTCGVGACAQTVPSCAGGEAQTCDPLAGAAPETCDGVDNDCDGQIDEQLEATSCGQGACEHVVPGCDNGAPVFCNPFEGAAPETCDGVDNNCDGQTDEDLGATTCGVGACEHTVSNCQDGAPAFCNPFEAVAAEACDAVDNDCDGETDEGLSQACYSGAPGTQKLGLCQAGVVTCSGGVLGSCIGEVLPASELCDGLDNDCDGVIDDDLGTTTCGLGQCEHTVDTCAAGAAVDCNPFEGASPEACDGLDNNCDGAVDEGFADTDADAIADCVDDDLDGDTLANGLDNCPAVANEDQADGDDDGAGDACDTDGALCTGSADCTGGSCHGGVCCNGDHCCLNASGCPATYGGPPTCIDAPSCASEQAVATCVDAICGTALVPAPQACDGGDCSDGDLCTTSDTCEAGVCAGVDTSAADCVDGEPCTDDGCDAEAGCTHTPNTDACDDGNACTTSDVCGDGACAGQDTSAQDCDDAIACTTDSCDAGAGCAHTPTDAACPPHSVCAPSETGADADSGCLAQIVVVGQPDFHSTGGNGTGATASTLRWPRSVTRVGDQWVVSDSGDRRLLIFDGAVAGTPNVIGQPDATTALPNGGQLLPHGGAFSHTGNVCSDGPRLFVPDGGNHRVLIWNSVPAPGQAADLVLGQTDMTSNLRNRGIGPDADTLAGPSACAVVGGKLVVADRGNNRILVYDPVPTTSGVAADQVIGQADFQSLAVNRGASTHAIGLDRPYGVSTDGDRLIVSDGGNNRVLIWDAVPTEADVPPKRVLGQPDFSTAAATGGAAGLSFPINAVAHDGGLYVLDYLHHRALWWSQIDGPDGAPADGVVGQADADALKPNRGLDHPDADTLRYPFDVLPTTDGGLWLVDSGNHRLLHFAQAPKDSDAAADALWGQSALDTTDGGVHNNGFLEPLSVAVSATHAAILDNENNRVLIFDKTLPTTGAIAVVGQPDFSSTLDNQGGEAGANTLATTDRSSVAIDAAERLYISDSPNYRILVYDAVPTTNDVAADFVLGQPDFSSTANGGCTKTSLNWPTGMSAYENRLFVADSSNNRALMYELPITQDQPEPVLVIGQPDFTTCQPGTTAAKTSRVQTALYDGQRFYVVEDGWNQNRRVLVWHSMPTVSGAAADVVIGQPDFTTKDAAGLGPDSAFGNEHFETMSVAVVDGYLLVPDKSLGRVLAFDTEALENGMAATFVIGQQSFDLQGFTPAGNSSNTAFGLLSGPTGILLDKATDHIWLTDKWGNRVFRVHTSQLWGLAYPPGADIDGDGKIGDADNCPALASPNPKDSDGDGVGDACDSCMLDPNQDADEDGYCANVDNCPDTANPDQLDTDGDGFGDACDL